MLLLTNLIAIMYIFILFKKQYPVSLSMYWVVVFYAIYIFVPCFKNNITLTQGINDEIVAKIALYSFIGLLSFISTNQLFLFRCRILEKVNIESMTIITYKATKRLLFLFFIITLLLFSLTIGMNGIITIFKSGSSNIWLDYENKNTIVTFAELSPFFLAILGSVLVLTSFSAKQKKKSFLIFTFVIIIVSTLVYARRHVIYPIFVVLFYYLSKTNKKTKIFKTAIIILPLFFISMFFMGYFRTFGVTNFNLLSVINFLKNGKFMDIFIENTDFAASYYFLSKQIDYGVINTSPLGYFKAIFAPIPRAIWQNKPQYTSVLILSILEPIKVSQGFSAATGYIGEALATMGVFGIILVSAIWGIICGSLDKRYQHITNRKQINYDSKYGHNKFTFFEYIYLYTAALLITESHRGDFGAASIDFIIEIVFIGLLLVLFSKKIRIRSRRTISGNTID